MNSADAAVEIYLIAGQSGPSSATSAPFSFTTTSVYQLGDLNRNFLAQSATKVDNFTFDVGGALNFGAFNLFGDRVDRGDQDGGPVTEPGAGTPASPAYINSEVGRWDDVGIPGVGDLTTTLNLYRNSSVVFDAVDGGFTDLVIAESGAYTPIDLSLCANEACLDDLGQKEFTTLFKGVSNGVLNNTLLPSSEFVVDEAGAAESSLDQAFLFRFTDPILDFVRVTEFGPRRIYTGDRLAVDFIGVGGDGGEPPNPAPVPLPAGLPLLAAGLALLGWTGRRRAA